MVSPMDWALIESWKEMQVPLHVALRGIEKAFDSWESKPRKRTVKSLLYCQEEVEAQYAEWLASRVGASDQAAAEAKQNGEGPAFSQAAILDHLKRGRSELKSAWGRRTGLAEDDFSTTLQRAEKLLADLEEEVRATAVPDAQKLEQSLSGLERMLGDAVRQESSEHLATHEAEVKDQLKPDRKHMEPAVYQQTLDNLLMKRLRDLYGIPRLSLFYL